MLNIKTISRVAAIVLSGLIIIFLADFANSINDNVKAKFYDFAGPAEPDSNFIIIHIDENDIERLGGWPLKRSYYALLFNQLNKLKVKQIGVEVFLSDNYSGQSIYNDIILEEVKKNKNIAFASLLSSIFFDEKLYIADSIIHPFPKKVINSVITGHINYTKSDGIYLPSSVKVNDEVEKPLSLILSESVDNSSELLHKVNLNTSWEKLHKYSVLEFFDLVENNDSQLKTFEGKTILIGVSDPSTAKTIETYFNDALPGVGFHAIAADSFKNSNGINYSYVNLSAVLFFVLFTLICFINKNFKIIISSVLIACMIFSYFLLISFNTELNYSVYLFISVLLMIAYLVEYMYKKNNQLTTTLTETEILKRALSAKETKLNQLEKELDLSSESSSEDLINKVADLKKEISELKKSEDDSQKAELSVEENEVKNFQGIVYRSKEMEKITSLVSKVAPEEATVLITGESGSGKELIAKAIHNLSKRKEEEFIAVNCAAMTDSLLESELFGHVKGAFTNAVSDKKGYFAAADEGTIFLDEIGETSENFQVKLLRVLQSGEYQRVGEVETQKSHARIIAATNKDLSKLIEEKKFREDLYYRLNVIQVELPKLKDRKEDVEILADFFAKREDENMSISKAVMQKLSENEWKGNVRELESIVKRAVIFAKAEKRKILQLNDLPPELSKFDKSNLENLILESLREKEFSHTAINETAKELGNLSRTIVSENFRGIVLKNYFDSSFDIEKTVKKICQGDNTDALSKVKSKLETYLKNIKKDLNSTVASDFDELKKLFSSKYKNLPQKYHYYLDEVIKHLFDD